MAASLSRPDPSSPASVAEAGFSTSRRGFNQDEVRAFLTSVAAELSRLQERGRLLQARLDAAEAAASSIPDLDDETVAARLGEETLRVLQTARESASQIKIRAEENAAKILHDANDEVNRLRQDSEVEVARKRHDAASDAEAEVALAKQQGREMVNEARAYRERVLADLERRTKLARHQIEDLVSGRDRLLQVFERARLVAVDVTSELQSIDAPAEFVNFSPTTGPLPLMLPASGLVEMSDDAVDAGDPDAELHVADDSTADTGDGIHDADAVDAVDPTVAVDGDVDADVVAETSPDVRTVPGRDANVVALFRDRSGAPTADEADTIDDTDHDDTERDDTQGDAAVDQVDVGDLFQRLRSEAPTEHDAVFDDDADHVDHADDAADAHPVDEELEADTPFSRRDEALVPLIVGGARRLKRVLADEQNGVLDLLRQHQPVTQLDELLDELDAHADTYVAALADELLEAAVAGAAEVGKRDSKTLRTTITKGGALGRAHAVLRDDLVLPLRSRLERAIVDGAGDNDDITKRIRAVYREWKTQHIDGQLDDAFRFAYGGGLAAGVKPGTSMTWAIDPSEPTCADCEDNSLAGAVAAGDGYPTGHVAAPAHPGCRCLMVPTGQ